MSKIAFLFPGQGSQISGMGKDIAENYKYADDIFNQANDTLGFDLKNICFNGTKEELTDTSITQPALFTTCAAIYEVVKRETNIKPNFVAGHSLGEYTAYYSADYVSFESCLKTVRKRGLLMANADKEGKGTMYAVLKLSDDKIEEICEKVAKDGSVIVPANYNSPGQVVISGEKEALNKAAEFIKAEKGRVIPLSVGGAFHSPLMKPANEELSKYILSEEFTLNKSDINVITNVYADSVPFENIKETLIKQLLSPVKWTASMNKLIQEGVDTFIEIGPGNVLQGLMKKIDKKQCVVCVQDKEGILKLMEII